MELLERDKELSALRAALESARNGEGRVVLISGEAGIGKTALARRFIDLARRVPAYWGACDALFTPRPLGPFADIAQQLRPAALPLLETGSTWHAAAAALLQTLSQSEAPAILVIEDIHWADEATLDMLKHMGRRVDRSRILLILTYRDDEPASARFLARLTGDLLPGITLRLALAPLSQVSVEQMAQRVERPSEGLFAATGGNPFFVTEALESEPDAVPASVRDLVLARFARLSNNAALTAQAVALIPGGAELALLDAVFGEGSASIDECIGQGVLADADGRMTYRHELARRAVEDTVPPALARQLHGQILRALIARHPEQPPLAQVAHHAAHAGDFDALRQYAPAAAQQASRLGAHREAAAHYRIVLNQLSSLTPETRAELLEGMSFECYLTGEIDAAFRARAEAAAIWRRLGRAEREGDNLRWLSRLAWFIGRRDEAEQLAQSAIEALETLPPGRELAMAYSNQSQLLMLRGESAAACEWGERAIALATQFRAPDILVHALTNVGTAELQAGEAQGWERLTNALALAQEEELHDDVGRAYANMISVAVQQRRYSQGLAWLDEGLAYMDERELDSYRVYLLGWRARLRLETGEWRLAEADARSALDEHAGASVIPIPALIALAHLKVRRGDADAGQWLEQARALCEPTAELQRIGPLAAARAEHAWWQGDRVQVETTARIGYELALQRGDPWALGQLAYWLWRAGESDLPLGRMAEPHRLMIEGNWRVAATAWDELGCPFEKALALAQGDAPAQIEALLMLRGLGARPALEWLKGELRRQGVKGIPRGPRPGTRRNPAGLTNRELEVLALLAEGLSNSAIAARLSISKKTVDHHVSALLSKLNVATRSEALAIAYREHLLT